MDTPCSNAALTAVWNKASRCVFKVLGVASAFSGPRRI